MKLWKNGKSYLRSAIFQEIQFYQVTDFLKVSIAIAKLENTELIRVLASAL